MAKRQASPEVSFEYCFDRLFAAKLEQAYDILVPDCTRRAGGHREVEGGVHESSSNLREGVIRATEGGQHDRQPNGSIEGICFKPRLQRTG